MKQHSLTTLCLCLASVWSAQTYANSACDANDVLTIVSATDDGTYDGDYGPHNAIDGDIKPKSRWSSESLGTPKSLSMDLGAEQTLKGLSIAWYKGDQRKTNFNVEVSVNGTDYQTVITDRQSGGATLELERYDFTPVQARYLRVNGKGNSSNDWNSLTEVVANGCGTQVTKPEKPVLTAKVGPGMFGLDPEKSPGENFDLSGWYVTTPADDDGDGKSDSVYENELAAGWTDPRFFYTDPATGGMVFRVTPAGAKTSKNTSYTRTELRGMLRRGDYSIETRIEGGYPNKNNWVFSSAPLSAQQASGGVDGKMTATLSVNQVTRQGSDNQVGRVVIGQIHAKHDEPIRLYYRKLPKNKFGSIYFAHDPEVGKERWVEVIGGRGSRIQNPADGIALDEVFTYEIEVTGKAEGDKIIPMLHLKIIRDDGTEVVAEPFDMRESGFSVEDEFMFFKAGAYTGNNTSPQPETDFDKVIFYKLDYSHDPAPEGDAKFTPKKVEKAVTAKAGVVFSDTFADGGRDNGADATDSNWWTTSTSSAIEVSKGSLGLVSGRSGRGIRTTFAPQTLMVGQSMTATFDFVTPETVGTNRDGALRVGLYDKQGRAKLEGDMSASSKSPNPAYDGLPGYMIDFDVNLKDPSMANIGIRKHKNDKQGRLLGTTKGYTLVGEGGDAYQFEAAKSYTGVLTLTKLDNGMQVTGALMQGSEVLSTFSALDEGSDVNNLGMLAFHANSKTFGTSKKPNEADNGIDFTKVSVEITE